VLGNCSTIYADVETPSNRFLLALKSIARLLTFRLTRDEFLQFRWQHLAVGLLFTWIVGMGRWWDDAGATMLQHLGVGSVIYIFILSLILWFEVLLLRPKNWSYIHVLTFVSMTSPPAILYAIPVERFLPLEFAQLANLGFLIIVASWRVALLAYYLRVQAKLKPFAVVVTTLLPLTAIVTTLTILNLERAAFVSMGGFRGTPTSHDSAYDFLGVLTALSILIFVPLVISYIVLAVLSWRVSDEE
jgi:hypothetical protein